MHDFDLFFGIIRVVYADFPEGFTGRCAHGVHGTIAATEQGILNAVGFEHWKHSVECQAFSDASEGDAHSRFLEADTTPGLGDGDPVHADDIQGALKCFATGSRVVGERFSP